MEKNESLQSERVEFYCPVLVLKPVCLILLFHLYFIGFNLSEYSNLTAEKTV